MGGGGSKQQKTEAKESKESTDKEIQSAAGLPENGVVVVFGGLGRQGGSVASAIAQEYPTASIRLVTRGDPESERAKAACKGNTTVHKANMNDPASLKPVLVRCE